MKKVRSEQQRNLVFRYFDIKVPDCAITGKFDKNSGKFLTGRACVVIARPPKNSSSKEFRAAVAFGSPLDSENRKKARDIATGRLLSARPGRNFTFSVDEDAIDLDSVFKTALKHSTNAFFVVEKHQRYVTYAPRWVFSALDSGTSFQEVNKN